MIFYGFYVTFKIKRSVDNSSVQTFNLKKKTEFRLRLHNILGTNLTDVGDIPTAVFRIQYSEYFLPTVFIAVSGTLYSEYIHSLKLDYFQKRIADAELKSTYILYFIGWKFRILSLNVL